MSSYIQSAEKRWPGRRVMGDGRFAVYAKEGGVVYLCLTPQQVSNVALGLDGVIVKVDLGLDSMLAAIPERESPEERRERRRAERAIA